MKESTKNHICSIVATRDDQREFSILRRFQFSSTLQRMTVVTQQAESDSFQIYCKGSPEIIMSLSRKDTVPSDLLDRLSEYTVQGYRVIAIGTRTLPGVNSDKLKKIARSDVEYDLVFVGLLIFENKLKPQTPGVIKVLKKAAMKVVMITGDNMQTAISVAKECDIVEKSASLVAVSVTIANKLQEPKLVFEFLAQPNMVGNGEVVVSNGRLGDVKIHFIITGSAWASIKEHFPAEIPKIVTLGTVFARMSSDQKQQLVVELQNMGYYVAMCGDGTNDCGALKAAHVGISLSEAEASVASPFTSREPNISCVTEVVKEGRAALVTSFGVFKFMLCYSLTEFISVIILYGIDCNLTSLQFLFIDICLVLNFASVFGITKAYDRVLFRKAPSTSLLAFIPVVSTTLHLVLVVVFQVISYYVIQSYDWFVPFEYDAGKDNYFTSYENYAIFTISMFQYIITAATFSKGKPYRKPMYTNRYLVTSIALMVLICSYITLHPAQWILNTLEMMTPPYYDARIVILAIALANFLFAFIAEDLVVDCLLEKRLKPKLFNLSKTRKRYLRVREDLGLGDWTKLQEGKDFSLPTLGDAENRANGIYNDAFEILDERL